MILLTFAKHAELPRQRTGPARHSRKAPYAQITATRTYFGSLRPHDPHEPAAIGVCLPHIEPLLMGVLKIIFYLTTVIWLLRQLNTTNLPLYKRNLYSERCGFEVRFFCVIAFNLHQSIHLRFLIYQINWVCKFLVSTKWILGWLPSLSLRL